MIVATLDCETLSLDYNAIIFEIAIFVKDFESEKVKELAIRPNIFEQIGYGRTSSVETLNFHKKIRGEKFFSDLQTSKVYQTLSIAECHKKMSEFFNDCDSMWVNGLSFDPVIFKTLFSSVGLDLPWPFYKEGDIRTINNYVLPTKVKNKPKTHDALSDAAWNMSVLNAFFEHKNKVATLLANDCGIQGKEVSELKRSKNQLLPIY